MNTPIRILNVESDEHDAQLTLKELREAGYAPVSRRVETLQSFQGALAENDWDVILADYSHPQFHGLDALKARRELLPDVPFVFVATEMGNEDVVAAMKAGANDCILKRELLQLVPAVKRELRTAVVRRARKACERELRDRDSLFRSVIENVADLIVVVDGSGVIRYCSPSVGRTLGYGDDELIGRSGLDLLPPDQQAQARDALARPSLHHIPSIAFQLRHKNGSWRFMEGAATNLLADPIVAGIVCNIRDVTEQRDVKLQLFRAQRMESIGHLAGGIAHDLNNMLTPILVAADLLQRDLPPPDRKMLIRSLTTGANRAAAVVHQLLLFSRGMRGDESVAGIGELIRETEQLLEFGFPKSIAVSTTLPDSVWPVKMGATEFTQILMNLCVNARDAMPEGGRLSIAAENVTVERQDSGMYPGVAPGRYVVLDVADTGGGIPPAIQKRIFDPYFTTKEDEGGTGLGLPTTCTILRHYGGFINAYSEEGEGTRFAVYIPAADATEEAATDPDTQASPTGQGELVLVIDDQGAIREVLRETLESHNYRVLTAGDGAIGLAIYRERSADVGLIVLDLSSPIVDNEAMIAAIRQINPNARVILQSGFISDNSMSHSGPSSADVFLERPYATDELLRCVHELLNRNRRTTMINRRPESNRDFVNVE